MNNAALMPPLLPKWYLGEEWNNPYVSPEGWLYANAVDWDALERNRSFYEEVKRMIRIRRTFPALFDYFPENHRETNICRVETHPSAALQAYARYGGGSAVLVRLHSRIMLLAVAPQGMKEPGDNYCFVDCEIGGLSEALPFCAGQGTQYSFYWGFDNDGLRDFVVPAVGSLYR